MAGWDKEELLSDMLHEIKELKGHSADEMGIEWDGEPLMVMDDFVRQFFDVVITKVCNVIKSYKDEL